MKKILSLTLVFLLIFATIFSLTSCGKEEEYTLGSATEVKENLEHNGYRIKYAKSVEALEKIEEGLSTKVSAYISAEKGTWATIIVYYCNDGTASEFYNKVKAVADTDSNYKAAMDGNVVYLASGNAVRASCEKLSRLELTFIEENNYKYITGGLKNTILITLGALCIGVVLGALIAVAKYYSDGNPKLRVVSFICDLYTTVIRGIPITVLLFIFFFIILVSADGMLVAVIAFGINSGAYMAELIRSGISAVDNGQMEAARSLGMSKWQAMRTIIFPQAVKNILPAIGNECIALLKETSVAGYVAVVDLTRGANLIRNNTYDAVNPLILTALIYLTIVIIMTKLLSILEKRLRKSEKH